MKTKQIIEVFFLLLALSLPLSVDVFFMNKRLGLSIPSEPLLFLLSFIAAWAFTKKQYRDQLFAGSRNYFTDLRFWVFLYWIWFFSSFFFSQMPMVSIKAFVSKTWFILPAFFLPILMAQNFKQQKKWIALFLVSLSLVVLYTLYQRYTFPDFHVFLSNRPMRPFFNDHTQYSAVLAMFFPLAVYFVFYASSKLYKYISFFISLLLLTGIVVSLCRTALLSLFPALIILIIVLLKIKWRTIFISGFVVLALLASLWIPVQDYAQKQSASKSEHPLENILSLANVQNDASGMERVNRWKCSYKIFRDYPVFGSGAATYSFIYAPYQDTADMTELSTMEGDNGNAHNEFLTALSDTGFIGFLLFTLIVIFSFITAIQAYRNSTIAISECQASLPALPNQENIDFISTQKDRKYFILAITLGLLTYYIHAFSNNFLDTAKVAVPLFYFTSILVLNKMNLKNLK